MRASKAYRTIKIVQVAHFLDTLHGNAGLIWNALCRQSLPEICTGMLWIGPKIHLFSMDASAAAAAAFFAQALRIVLASIVKCTISGDETRAQLQFDRLHFVSFVSSYSGRIACVCVFFLRNFDTF